MNIPFWKMHGAANDFILVDDRKQTFPARDRAWLAAIMARRTGVGSEGVLLIQPAAGQGDFRMRFFNPDGGEADLCGNGARCLARLAHEIGAAPAAMKIETAAGLLRAEVSGEQVVLHLPDPKDWRLNQHLTTKGEVVRYHFVNTGVPHAVVEVEDPDAVNVQDLGARIRQHEVFSPDGANANFIVVTGPSSLRLRTYERGVEAETLACGTGIVASGLIAGRLGRVRPPLRITARSGDVLEVNFSLTEKGASGVTLRGPAVHVFQGNLAYP